MSTPTLEDAEKLCSEYSILWKGLNMTEKDYIRQRDNIKEKFIVQVGKSIKLYKKLFEDGNLKAKIAVLSSFFKYLPEDATDLLANQRDMITFARPSQQANIISLITEIACLPHVPIHERAVTAISLYNNSFLDKYVDVFTSIATDEKADTDYRVEACRFLFANGQEETKECAQECLLSIIENHTIPSTKRYDIIAGFISKTGIKSILNSTKINVPYDEMFLYGLQSSFFFDKTNGIRERILSGQHLLDMSEEFVSVSDKEQISEDLMNIGKDSSLEESVRADALDVVRRLSSYDQKIEALKMIKSIGESHISPNSANALERVSTIYNNSQNIHNEKIEEGVNKFMSSMMSRQIKIKTYEEVTKDLNSMLKAKGHELTPRQKFSINSSLRRIRIDTAKFTEYKFSMLDIFLNVWSRICLYDGEQRELLFQRMLEELIEMGDTCSYGHGGRFVNVLSGVEEGITIDFSDQVIANVAGRINARMRDIKDTDIKQNVYAGMLKDSEKTIRDVYITFIKSALEEVKEELYKEFVDAKFISEKEFDTYFTKASNQWID